METKELLFNLIKKLDSGEIEWTKGAWGNIFLRDKSSDEIVSVAVIETYDDEGISIKAPISSIVFDKDSVVNKEFEEDFLCLLFIEYSKD